jgi:hypothetical protein
MLDAIILVIAVLIVLIVPVAASFGGVYPGFEITADLKGAIAGGVVAALIDKTHTWHHRFLNGCGAVAFAYALTPGVMEALQLFGFKGGSGLLRLVACILALIGVILAETIQRIAKRILLRSDDIGDKLVDKLGKSDEKDRN